MNLDLESSTDLCRLLGDATRVRLLALLGEEELTVAELVAVTRLPQPRISTHLRRLREAGMVRDRRVGSYAYYAFNREGVPEPAARLWAQLRAGTADPVLAADLERARAAVAARDGGELWADAVAGAMERHYAPGRTWESLARALPGLARLGRVLDVASGDGAVAELIAPRAASVTCLDISEKVVAAGRARLKRLPHVRFLVGDMHALPFEDDSFDAALLLNALSYTERPGRVMAEVARVLAPGGVLVGIALREHAHRDAVGPYNHLNSGTSPAVLAALAADAGLAVDLCAVTSRERRSPHFEIITLHARVPTE
jgi:SAM-dependent methyltransferase